MYGCESWTIKKAEPGRIDTFELWCWRRLLKVPWTARRSNQSILKEISPEYSLEGLMLKHQYFGHLMQRTDSLEKTLMLGKMRVGGEGDDREWHGWMASATRSWVWVSSGSWWWTGKSGMLQSMGSQRIRHDWVTELSWKTGRNTYVISMYVFFCVSCDHVLCVWSYRCASVVCMYISVYAQVVYVKFVCAYVYTSEKAMAPPLHYSCLENPRDGGAWWAAIYGVAQSRTPLKLLSSSSSNMYTHEHLMYDYATSMFIYTCAFLFMWVCRCVGICVWVFLCI